jgi:plastocyanin
MERRTFVRTLAGSSLIAVAGCGGGGSGEATETRAPNEIIAGPGGNLSFDPAELTVSTGTTVTWRFDSGGHNVACDPANVDDTALPADAEPFTSYDGGNTFETNAAGTTFSHTFSVAGEYDYVCVPHISSGMTGTIVVEE